jgi:hypothetical protein
MFCTGLGPPGSGSKLNTLRPHNPEKSGTVAARAGPTAAAATMLNAATYTDNLCIVARMMPLRWRQSSSEIRGLGSVRRFSEISTSSAETIVNPMGIPH